MVKGILNAKCLDWFFNFTRYGFCPNAPEWVNWLVNWIYVTLVFTVLLWIAGVVLQIVAVKFGKSLPRSLFRKWMPLFAAVISVIGIWNCVSAPEIAEYTFRFVDLPDHLEGTKILQISDIHVSASARRERTEKIVELANGAGADLIVVTGDLVDGTPENCGADVEPLKNLKARHGVYFTTGNHEYYHDFPRWRRLYDEWGLRFLLDEWVVPIPGLVLAGMNNRHDGITASEFAKVFKKAPDGFRILLTHNPKDGEDNVARGVDLQLSGHCHGGLMPGISMVVAAYNGKFVKGLYEFRSGKLFVTPGAGQWAGFPIRFFNPCELSLITLRKDVE